MLTLLAVGLLSVCATACGDAHTRTREVLSLPGTGARGYIRGDQDGDPESNASDADDAGVRDYGHPANATGRRTIAVLLKRYYAAAAAGDSAAACSLTSAGLAKSTKFLDAVSEDYAPTPGSPPLRGKSCLAVMSVLVRERHGELLADADSLVVTGVRVHGHRGLAFVGFSTTGERVVALKREHGAWSVDGLFDGEVR